MDNPTQSSRTARPFKEYTLAKVARVISERSTCRRRQVGCVIANKMGWILATGYNGIARGLPHCTENSCPGVGFPSGTNLDMCQATHAEQSAIVQLRFPLEAFILISTTAPCISCVKLILITSIKHILYVDPYSQHQAKTLWLSAPGRTWHALDEIGNRSIFDFD